LLGLEHAHSQGFLHRDIKPGNILLSPNTPKLSDFGLATQTAGPAAAGSAQGYITHLLPEYFVSHVTTVKTEVFAAGVTLFRAVSKIFARKTLMGSLPDVGLHVQRGTLIETIGFESYIPAVIQRIVKKACSANPDKRYESAKAF
jgi:serine/threonine protein kinase